VCIKLVTWKKSILWRTVRKTSKYSMCNTITYFIWITLIWTYYCIAWNGLLVPWRCSPETSMATSQSTRRNIPADLNFHHHRCEKVHLENCIVMCRTRSCKFSAGFNRFNKRFLCSDASINLYYASRITSPLVFVGYISDTALITCLNW